MITFIKSRVCYEKLNVRQPYLLPGKKKNSASIQKKKKSKEVQRKVLACSRTTHLENLHLKNMFTSASLCKAAQTIISLMGHKADPL